MANEMMIGQLKTQRRFWFQVHLYLGLTLGSILSIVGLTGSVLVFWMELDEFLNPRLLHVEPRPGGYRSWEEIARSARAALPQGAALTELYWPRHRSAAAVGFYTEPNPRAGNRLDACNIFIDPYTAKVTGKRLWYSAESWWKNPFLGIMFKIHYALMIRAWGVPLVGVLSVFFVILTLSGLCIWWPITGKWRSALTMMWTGTATRLNFELHKAAGFYSLIVLLMLLLTGIYFNLPRQVVWLIERVSSVERPAFPVQSAAASLPLTLDGAAAAAQRIFPNSSLYEMELSAAGHDPIVRIEQIVPLPLGLASRRHVTINLENGEITHLADPLRAPLGTAYIQWQWPLHSGHVWGWPGRISVFFSGLVCPLLLVTGFARWLWKRRKKREQWRNGTSKTWARAGTLAGTLLLAVHLIGQVPEFNFYPEFRRWWFALPADQRQTFESVVERYKRRLSAEGTPAEEIDRRLQLMRTRRTELEADFWDRFFTSSTPEFNTKPNAFLMSVVEGRPAGRALDVGMGAGRNTIFLAQRGWEVTGFDPAGKAVALAQQRAKELGLTIHTQVALDREFDFGQERWDLILLSWMPPNEVARIVAGLRPGGIVVFEGPRTWFPQNGLLKQFDALRVIRYEDQVTRSDYFVQSDIPVVRLLAEKPGR